jgi:hypothetical protein
MTFSFKGTFKEVRPRMITPCAMCLQMMQIDPTLSKLGRYENLFRFHLEWDHGLKGEISA